jgi:phosphatidylserine/phosphatidylglycerophosphate/cardiolipin synthase-like enzyme
MQDILSFLEKSFDDGYLSKSEKKALKAIISENAPSKQELDWLRSQVFTIAKSKISGFDNIQILEWLEEANKLVLPKISNHTFNKAYFSPGHDCLNAVIKQIAYATKSIDICVFTISDDRIKEKLLYAKIKGIKIRIITDNDKSFDRGSDIHTLASNGIPVKIDTTNHHMHHKFALFDTKELLTGSYNWTRSATEFNQENILVTNEISVVIKYQEEFNRLWNKMADY